MGNSYSLELDYNFFVGSWMMNPASFAIASSPDNCISIDPILDKFIIPVSCVQLAGQGFGLNLYFDPYLETWAIQLGSITLK